MDTGTAPFYTTLFFGGSPQGENQGNRGESLGCGVEVHGVWTLMTAHSDVCLPSQLVTRSAGLWVSLGFTLPLEFEI